LLAQVVHGEARGEDYIGKVAVAAVVLNRMESPQFPNTLKEVVFQPRAFTCVDDGQIRLTPDLEAYKAAFDAILGSDPTGGCLFYMNPRTATSRWMHERISAEAATVIGNHVFVH
jgi:N-acetylmuramoyl-L-alanine amidase